MIEFKPTFCRICECGCGTIAEVEDNVIRAIRGNPAHVVSRGHVCKKGATFHEIVHSPDRLRYPMKRTGAAWERISWDLALREIGARVKRLVRDHGGDSIALYAGSGSGFSLLHPIYAKGFIDGIGSKSVYAAASIDCSNKFAVARLMYGSPLIQTFPDLEHIRCLIMLGANPVATNMSFAGVPDIVNTLKGLSARGARVVYINPRRTESAKVAGEHYFIRPGTDRFFLLGFARELIVKNGVDRGAVDAHVKNYDLLREVVWPWTMEKVAAVTGVPAAAMEGLVDSYVSAKSSALYCSTGINMSGDPSTCFWLLEAINAISGNLDRRGGTIVGRGLVDFPRLSRGSFAAGGTTSRIGGFPQVMDSFPCAVMHDEILEPGPGQIRGLFVSGGNPAVSFPDSARCEAALGSLDLLVSVDIFRNETGNLAHYLLPATTFMEHGDINYIFQSMLGVYPVPVLNYSDAVIAPDGEQRDETRIYADLARACGARLFGSRLFQWLNDAPWPGGRRLMSPENIFRFLLRVSGKSTLGKMRKRPEGLLLGPHRPGSFLGARVLTADGRVDCAPRELVEAARGLDAAYDGEMKARGRIKLVNMREPLSFNTYLHNAPSLMKGNRRGNRMRISPEDAARAGLADGDLAEVASETGSIRIPVIITDDMMPGAVAIPHGWGHERADGITVAQKNHGVNVNILTPSGARTVDPVSGMARLAGIPVTVKKFDGGTEPGGRQRGREGAETPDGSR